MVDAVHTETYEEGTGEPAGMRCAGFRDAGTGAGWQAPIAKNQTRPIGVAARFVVRLVACALQTDEAEMLSSRRGTPQIARARQIAMYLLHTNLSIAYADVAVMFERDRTTVSHACRTIEDLRDDPLHDDRIGRLEEMVDLARSMSMAERQADRRRMLETLAGA